ncbi:MAG: sigma-70 family RNA polymerase sigma factor [Verrucomicrobiales bacterium]|nr:sigma-70 family RNA polymerase sigma factor [Verrucomicrobiales bacterium]
MNSLEEPTDTDLVAACLDGDRDAFGRIVGRYQSLLCSLAYSATGSLHESEDLAQETFVEAWRQLHTLRDSDKLRPWLCGILRFKASRWRRSDGREPVRQAEPLEQASDVPSPEEPAADLAMDREEQALLWRTLERVPELYREPLILYYREHRSVEHVAVALDLSEEAVKQRLSRGRRILQERMLCFVEGALHRSTPGRVFTAGVLAALPGLAPKAEAAALGAAATQGGLLAKSAGLAPLITAIAGTVSTVLTLRANLDQARTPRERRAVVRITATLFFGALGLLVILYLLRDAALRWPARQVLLTVACQGIAVAFMLGWPAVVLGVMRAMRRLRTSERLQHPELFQDPRDQVGSPEGEYRSARQFLGVPLVHLRFSAPDAGAPPVVAWFAGGDRAYGLLFAAGGWAVAPFSIGAVSVGLVSIGTLGVGVFSVGTAAVGVISLGCLAAGVQAFGWLSALGWQVAKGSGFAIAGTVAVGPVAFAPHANDAVARQLLSHPGAEQTQIVFLAVVSLLAMAPAAIYARSVRRRLGGRPATSRQP